MRFEYNGELYAIYAPIKEVKEGTEWFGTPHHTLQAGRMKYPKGKVFKLHKHIMNPRLIKRTQETFTIISGSIEVTVFSDDQKESMIFLLKDTGDKLMLYKGYHEVKVLEDTIFEENKAGQFDGYLSEEKEYSNV